MKIAYFIHNFGHGRGGHFFSLKEIRGHMPNPGELLVIGDKDTPIFDGKNYFIDFKSGYFNALKKAKKILKYKGITHLHSFDYQSLIFCNVLSYFCHIPHIHTKPGGPSPKVYFPLVRYLTIFSKEDLKSFKSRRNYFLEKISLISNRVTPFNFNKKLQEEIRFKAGEKKIVLRITRISEKYIFSIFQTIELSRWLNQNGINSIPVIVGVIQEKSAYLKLIKYIGDGEVLIFTEDKYTVNGKAILGCGDFVVGTGRSFMEAAFAKTILFAPSENMKLPIFVTSENYNLVAHSNYSGRGIYEDCRRSAEKLFQCINKSSVRSEYDRRIKEIYLRDFDIGNGISSYLETYNLAVKPDNVIILTSNVIFLFLRKFIYFILNKKIKV